MSMLSKAKNYRKYKKISISEWVIKREKRSSGVMGTFRKFQFNFVISKNNDYQYAYQSNQISFLKWNVDSYLFQYTINNTTYY